MCNRCFSWSETSTRCRVSISANSSTRLNPMRFMQQYLVPWNNCRTSALVWKSTTNSSLNVGQPVKYPSGWPLTRNTERNTMRVKELYFWAEVEEKLWKKHQLAQDEVQLVLRRQELSARFERHVRHGYRARVKVCLQDGDTLLLWLRPINIEEGTWSVITAYVVERWW